MAVHRVLNSEAPTTTLPVFNGEGDVGFFIASLDYYFSVEDIPELCRTAIAQECIGESICLVLNQLARRLGKVLKRPWIWTWASMKLALVKIQGQW